ncbi:MAG TPA: ROK family protein [Tepidisphaeraceae bacterium]|jgi:glucokinase|nr:ROK family protein [Tepidisphaeraceae bacterium]
MFLGVEIGGTKLQVVAAGAGGDIARRWRANVRPEFGGRAICDQIAEGIAEICRADPAEKIRSAGVGFGGPIDIATGTIRKSHQIPGWENFPLRDWLADLIAAPVAVDNDANVAAFGEARRGAGAGFDPVFYVTMGSGVGGGMVAGGRIYHGMPPGESEFGHVRLDRDGAIVESRCSGWAVDARIRALGKAEPDSLLARSIYGATGCEARFLAPALAAGDAAASRLLREIADDLAFALSHVIHLMHPRVIVLGGGLSLVGEPLRLAVETALPPFVMKAFWPPPEVRLAGLGEDAVPAGAIELAKMLV